MLNIDYNNLNNKDKNSNSNDEHNKLMLYHTTLRNIIGLLTLIFIILTFTRHYNVKKQILILKSFAFVISLMALYLNIYLIYTFISIKNKYNFVNKYLYINYVIAVFIVLILLFILL